MSRSQRQRWRIVALSQAIYFLATGVWPIVHLSSFLTVTGEKTDLWLVQFFGVLVCVPGAVLAHAAWSGRLDVAILITAVGSAGVLLAGDVIYVMRGWIGPIYLLDAAVETAFIAAWALTARGSAAVGDALPGDDADESRWR